MSRHRGHWDVWDEHPSTDYLDVKTWVTWFSPLPRVTRFERNRWHLIRLHVERRTKASSWSLRAKLGISHGCSLGFHTGFLLV